MNASQVMDVNAKSMPKAKSMPARLVSMEYKHGDNGGHVFVHRMESGDGRYHEPETHVFGKGEGKMAMAHFAKVAGIKGDSDSAAGAST